MQSDNATEAVGLQAQNSMASQLIGQMKNNAAMANEAKIRVSNLLDKLRPAQPHGVSEDKKPLCGDTFFSAAGSLSDDTNDELAMLHNLLNELEGLFEQ